MQTIRILGNAAAPAATAQRGAMASSHGKARATPAPRRNVRRGSVIGISSSSPILKDGTLYYFVNQRTKTVILFAISGHDLLHCFTVAESEAAARRIDQQLLGQATGQLVLIF